MAQGKPSHTSELKCMSHTLPPIDFHADKRFESASPHSVVEAEQHANPQECTEHAMEESSEFILLDDSMQELRSSFAGAGVKVLLLDYDGTLRGFEDDPAMAVPDDDLLDLLDSLNKREDFRVVIISGRQASFLEEQMGQFDRFTFVAEHGSQIRKCGKSRWELAPSTPVSQSRHWRMLVLNCVHGTEKLFNGGIRGTFVEEKARSMVWHYRGAPETEGHEAAISLVNSLGEKYPLERVVHGHKMVEVFGPRCTSKGEAMNQLLDDFKRDETINTVLCAGDDVTDESMFRVQRADVDIKSVKIGKGITSAKYRITSPIELLTFLRSI